MTDEQASVVHTTINKSKDKDNIDENQKGNVTSCKDIEDVRQDSNTNEGFSGIPDTNIDFKIFQTLGHSLFESTMLVWSTTTGQMNNHCAIHAHTDGNLSHEIETMTLFGRIDPSELNLRGTSGDSDFKFKSGYLLFPLDSIVIKLSCAKMNIHCNLKNTFHVPDNTRNTHNWSKVHEPKF
jgi:hypothetical protein